MQFCSHCSFRCSAWPTCGWWEPFKLAPVSFQPSLLAFKHGHVCVCVKSLQSCPTPCEPMTVARQVPQVHGILQARILEWVAMPSSRGSSPTQGSKLYLLCLLHWQAGSSPRALPQACPYFTAARDVPGSSCTGPGISLFSEEPWGPFSWEKVFRDHSLGSEETTLFRTGNISLCAHIPLTLLHSFLAFFAFYSNILGRLLCLPTRMIVW